MKVRMDKFQAAVDSLRRAVTSYHSSEMKQHSVNIEVVEADLSKDIPVSVMTISCGFEKVNGEKEHITVEIYDDMDSIDPIITTRKTVKLD